MNMFTNPGIRKAIKEAMERKRKAKAERKRLAPFAKKNARKGEKFKVLARPYERRRKIDVTYNVNIKQTFQVVIRAISEDRKPRDVTRIWTTINGSNVDIRRPSKGIGKYGDMGPYVINYKPASTGISKLKVQVDGDEPGIIFYEVKSVGKQRVNLKPPS